MKIKQFAQKWSQIFFFSRKKRIEKQKMSGYKMFTLLAQILNSVSFPQMIQFVGFCFDILIVCYSTRVNMFCIRACLELLGHNKITI